MQINKEMKQKMETVYNASALLNRNPWYDHCDVVNNKIIVYTKYINSEVEKAIPAKIDNLPVLVHFADSIFEKSKYVNNASLSYFDKLSNDQKIKKANELELKDKEIAELEVLMNKIDVLISQYTAKVVEEIFYECHDGENAITNNKPHYLNLFATIEELYDEHGFDKLYHAIMQ